MLAGELVGGGENLGGGGEEGEVLDGRGREFRRHRRGRLCFGLVACRAGGRALLLLLLPLWGLKGCTEVKWRRGSRRNYVLDRFLFEDGGLQGGAELVGHGLRPRPM